MGWRSPDGAGSAIAMDRDSARATAATPAMPRPQPRAPQGCPPCPPPQIADRIGKPNPNPPLDPSRLDPNPFSLSLYGDPSAEIDDLLPSIREHGILVPLVVAARPEARDLGGPFRTPAAGLCAGPGSDRGPLRGPSAPARRCAATRDPGIQPPAPQDIQSTDARSRRPRGTLGIGGRAPVGWRTCAAVRSNRPIPPTAPNVGIPTIGPCDRIPTTGRSATGATPPAARGRTDAAIARHLGMGGKDLYRQARAIWRLARSGDARARSGVAQLDAGTKTIHAALQGLTPPRPLQRRFPPHAVRRLVVPPRPGLRHPPPRLHPAGPGGARAPLLHVPRRPGRRPDGRRRDHARRLPVDGTPLPGL